MADASPVYTFNQRATPPTANQVVTILSNTLTKDEKCTYVVKATCGAPGFIMKDLKAKGNFVINYVEYDKELVGSANMENGQTDYPNKS